MKIGCLALIQPFSPMRRQFEPIRWAKALGAETPLDPHGVLTDTVVGMSRIPDALGHEETVGGNLDTGNSWLGGGDLLAFVRTFGPRIKHVHWKDLPAERLHRGVRAKPSAH